MDFVKVSATGNDFILIDASTLESQLEPLFIKKLCKRSEGIGSDGLILLAPSSKADGRMIYYNADGGRASFCGNGLRATAFFAKRLGWPCRLIESDVCLHHISFQGEGIQVSMPEAYEMGPSFFFSGFVVHKVFLGVPHAVIFVEHLDSIDVKTLGGSLRHGPEFGLEGCNVNFVEICKKNRIRIRTFERGVEAETLSCGSGAAAAAFIGHSLGVVNSLLEIIFKSGERAQIEIKGSSLSMQGPVTPIYTGTICKEFDHADWYSKRAEESRI
ncbi:MAG: diaminopimelate epimerase [Simkaniaceae bacterium]